MRLILPALVSFIFSSCYTYQYFTVSSNYLSKNEENEFIAENDTLKIVYHFSAYNSSVKLTLYNKTNEPLEINWKKSALIINEKATSYYSPNLLLNGSVRTDSSRSFP